MERIERIERIAGGGNEKDYQAGGSPRGIRFASKHAEAVFLAQSDPKRCASYVKQVRQVAAEQGRDPNHIKVLMGFRCAVAKDRN